MATDSNENHRYQEKLIARPSERGIPSHFPKPRPCIRPK